MGRPPRAPPTELNPVGEFQMINVGDFRMIIDRASFESCFEQIPPGFPTVGASLTLFLTDGALLGLCSAWAVSSFLPVPRLGLVNPGRLHRLFSISTPLGYTSYHWPGCPNYEHIAEHNRVAYPNAVAAEKAGYRAARNCP